MDTILDSLPVRVAEYIGSAVRVAPSVDAHVASTFDWVQFAAAAAQLEPAQTVVSSSQAWLFHATVELILTLISNSTALLLTEAAAVAELTTQEK